MCPECEFFSVRNEFFAERVIVNPYLPEDRDSKIIVKTSRMSVEQEKEEDGVFFRIGKLKLSLMLCKPLYSVNRMVITSTEATSPSHRMLTEALKPKKKWQSLDLIPPSRTNSQLARS